MSRPKFTDNQIIVMVGETGSGKTTQYAPTVSWYGVIGNLILITFICLEYRNLCASLTYRIRKARWSRVRSRGE